MVRVANLCSDGRPSPSNCVVCCRCIQVKPATCESAGCTRKPYPYAHEGRWLCRNHVLLSSVEDAEDEAGHADDAPITRPAGGSCLPKLLLQGAYVEQLRCGASSPTRLPRTFDFEMARGN